MSDNARNTSGPSMAHRLIAEALGTFLLVFGSLSAALFAAGNGPDQRFVAGIELVDTGFLFNDGGAVQAQPGLAGHDQVAAQPGGNRHAAVAADGARDDTNDGGVTAQPDNGAVDVANGGQAQVGFLQPYATGFQ